MPTIRRLRDNPRPRRTYDNRQGRRGERHAIYDTTRWRELRAAKFLEQPLCERCLERGRVRPADEIHHIVSFMSVDDQEARRALAYDFSNLMSLCSDCHHEMHHGHDYTD